MSSIIQKSPGTCTDTSLQKMNELVIHVNSEDDIKFTPSCNAEEISLRIVGDGNFWTDSNCNVSAGKTIDRVGRVDTYASKGEYDIFISSRYLLTSLTMIAYWKVALGYRPATIDCAGLSALGRAGNLVAIELNRINTINLDCIDFDKFYNMDIMYTEGSMNVSQIGYDSKMSGLRLAAAPNIVGDASDICHGGQMTSIVISQTTGCTGTCDQWATKEFSAGRRSGTVTVTMPGDAGVGYRVTFSSTGWTKQQM